MIQPGVLWGVATGAAWGVADFAGGLASRRAAPIAVTAASRETSVAATAAATTHPTPTTATGARSAPSRTVTRRGMTDAPAPDRADTRPIEPVARA